MAAHNHYILAHRSNQNIFREGTYQPRIFRIVGRLAPLRPLAKLHHTYHDTCHHAAQQTCNLDDEFGL
jgi:hypothetical protein